MQGFSHYSDDSMKLRVKFYYLGFLFCFFVDLKEILTYDFRP